VGKLDARPTVSFALCESEASATIFYLRESRSVSCKCFICAKAKRQQQCFICAKAKRQLQMFYLCESEASATIFYLRESEASAAKRVARNRNHLIKYATTFTKISLNILFFHIIKSVS